MAGNTVLKSRFHDLLKYYLCEYFIPILLFQVKAKDRLFVMKVDPPLLVADDVRIEFNAKPYKVPIPVPDKDKFHFWFNTFFYDKVLCPFSKYNLGDFIMRVHVHSASDIRVSSYKGH